MRFSFRLVVIAVIFITCLMAANVVAVKIIAPLGIILPAAVIVFPISYILGDVLTEVYGLSVARRVIWLGFACNLLFVLIIWVAGLLPAAGFWEGQPAYDAILGYTPRLLAASLCGYLVGELVNSNIMARMKAATHGRWLWSRTIASTIVGEGLDTAIFITVAFWGTPSFVPVMILYHWGAKTLIEVVATPLTYGVVNYLKRREGAARGVVHDFLN